MSNHEDGYQEALRRIEEVNQTNATELDLSGLSLSELPAELWQLSSLTSLMLNNNQLSTLPSEIGQLTTLQVLLLSGNNLNSLPIEIGQLTNLLHLNLDDNQLRALPPELGNLKNLQYLSLTNNNLTKLPLEIYQLGSLEQLFLQNLHLSNIPSEIGQLKSLNTLSLSGMGLDVFPSEVTMLPELRCLFIHTNHLSEVSSEIWKLINLEELYIKNNQLKSLPSEIGQLANLSFVDLRNNQLSSLPPEIGQITSLVDLVLDGNPLISPPPSIIQQGTGAILVYLRELLDSHTRIWRSKMLVVGEGAVGKTSLIKHLRGEPFDPNEDKTHSMQIGDVDLPHSSEKDVIMHLKTWDFGGQDIYHATHQFFYSNRSLFLVVWNARIGYEQSKIPKWLDMIHSLAPESPILIVATHIDEHAPDIPLSDFQDQYEQIVGMVKISNLTGEGIPELKAKIQELAADLPLMGELWPGSWRNAAEAIMAQGKTYSDPDSLVAVAGEHEVDEKQARILLNWMHSLGDILYFEDTPELKDIIILDPEWVSQRIGDVLVDKMVIAQDGIFKREDMDIVWDGIPGFLRDMLLRMMERFDLSYMIPDDPDNRCLIVERLSHEEANFENTWQSLNGQNELTMRFRIPQSNMPPGIPTWFIARSHRFTTHTHWRTGGLFRDKTHQHYALVRAFPERRYVELKVRGPAPHSFFSLMRDGLDVTFDRFEGLGVKRVIPCPGHNSKPCDHEFDLRHVERQIARKNDIIDCPITEHDDYEIAVQQLAFGVKLVGANVSIIEELHDVKRMIAENNEASQAILELVQRGFTTQFRAMQHDVDSTCPNLMTLYPLEGQHWATRPFGQKMRLQLYCQAPGEWHFPVDADNNMLGYYTISDPAKWLKDLAPYLNLLVNALKFATPVVGSWLNFAHTDWYKAEFESQMNFTKSLVSSLKTLDFEAGASDFKHMDVGRKKSIDGANLRVLRHLLEELDPSQHWGGLRRVLTPEGHYLWLCEHHAKSYLEWVG